MSKKCKVIDPEGFRHDGVTHAPGTELELSGPFLEAALRFKQVEEVKEGLKKPDPKK